MQEKEQKISPIKQRILHFIEYLGISKRDFYSNAGISRGTLESKTGITEDIMAKFIATYPSVNIEWLITGDGEMIRETENFATMQEKEQKNANCNNNCSVGTEKVLPREVKDNQSSSDRTPHAYLAKDGSGGIPLIPTNAMAGALTGDNVFLEYECEHYVVPAFRGADFLISVKGSSMYPKYSSGDIVACQRVPLSGLFFQWNKVYVIDTNQGPLIKRIKPGLDNDHVLIVSDNPKYDPFQLAIQDIHAVALVIGVIRLE